MSTYLPIIVALYWIGLTSSETNVILHNCYDISNYGFLTPLGKRGQGGFKTTS